MRTLKWLVALGLGVPATLTGLMVAVLYFYPLLRFTDYWYIGYPLLLPQAPRVFTGDPTPVMHTIRGRTFAIPKAYLPNTDQHDPVPDNEAVTVWLEAKLPDFSYYEVDPYAGNGRVLTEAEHETRLNIELRSVKYRKPIPAWHFDYESDECRFDEASRFEVCKEIGSTEIWRKQHGKAKISMLCDTGEDPPLWPHCDIYASLMQNVNIEVSFLAIHRPHAEEILSDAVGLACSWYRPDPNEKPLTFNYCEERIYAVE